MSESASSRCSASSYYSSSSSRRVNKEDRDAREESARSGGSGHSPTTTATTRSTAATTTTSAASVEEEWPEVAPKKDHLDKQLPKAQPAPKIDGKTIANGGSSGQSSATGLAGKVLSRHVSTQDLSDGSEETPLEDLEAGQDKDTRKRPLAAGQEKAHKKQRVEEPMALPEGVSPFEAIRKNVWGGKDDMSDDEFALLEEMMMAEEKTDPLLFSPPEAEDPVNVKVPMEHVSLVNQVIKGIHTPLTEFAAGSSSGHVKPSMIMPLFGRCVYEIDRRLRQAVVMFGAAMQSKRYYDGLNKDMKAAVTERDTLRKDKKALQEKVTDLEKGKANADKLREEIVRLKEEKAKLSKEKVAAKSHLTAALAQLDA